MKLFDFLQSDDVVLNEDKVDKEAGRPCCDTRHIGSGDVFFAIDRGKEHIMDAIKKGASAVVSDEGLIGVDVIVKNIRARFASFCASYYDHPERKLKIVAVTGTNGKTSTVKIVAHILRSVGIRTATIGTLGAEVGGEMIETGFTTPDSDVFYRILGSAVEKHTSVVVMELSAHAIFYKKTYGVVFDVCVFTNLTRDHLDFFKNMQKYADVKKSIFLNNDVKTAIINGDDNVGKEIISQRKGRTVSVGIYGKYDYCANGFNGTKSEYTVNNNGEGKEVSSRLSGEFNVYNVLSALAVCRELGVNIDDAIHSVKSIEPIPGRFNVIERRGITVVIDYAHTPDGLEKILVASRGICSGRIICVFGCGGDRDRTKRPLMGRIAEKYADICVITSDNPRNEDPTAIIKEIEKGFCNTAYTTISDRKEAVYYALDTAKEGDLVLIAGKGAENYVEIRGEKIPFSDREAVESYFRRDNW